MKVVLALLFIATSFAVSEAIVCLPEDCSGKECPAVTCPYGATPGGVCNNCCEVCNKGPGEVCGDHTGLCAENLQCCYQDDSEVETRRCAETCQSDDE